MYVYMCGTFMSMSVCACGGQEITLGIVPQVPSIFLFIVIIIIFFRKVFS